MNGTTTATSINKSIGYTKNKSFEYRQLREENSDKKQRFKRRITTLDDMNNSLSSNNLLSTLNTDAVIEMGSIGGYGAGALTPQCVDVYDEIQEKLKKMGSLHREVQKLIANKIKSQFGNNQDLDAQIEKKNSQATAFLQECEAHLVSISKMDTSNETPAQTRIRKNMEKHLAVQIQEAAMMFRKQQKGLLDKIKEQDTGVVSELNVEQELDMDDDAVREMAIMEDLARERDEDVNKLVDSINKLNQLFKDMNQLVIDQGTIVDRIDYNVEKSADTIVKAKKELIKAKKDMDSKCASYCIMLLIVGIIICSVILVFKFAK